MNENASPSTPSTPRALPRARRSFPRATALALALACTAACAFGQAPAKSVSVRDDHKVEGSLVGRRVVSLNGRVVSDADEPVAGLEVVASPLGADSELFPLVARATTDAKGAFALQLDDGLYSVSVLGRGADAKPRTALVPRARPAEGATCELAYQDVDLPFGGNVVGADGAGVKGALVHVERREDGAMFHAETDAEGRFAITLPRGTWHAFAESNGLRSDWQDRVGPTGHRLTLASPLTTVGGVVSKELAAELGAALALARTAPPGERMDVAASPIDAGALAKQLGSARVVGLGDALRGTHEELAFGAELFRALVEQHGVQLLAIDAPFGEVWNLNAWVLEGKGDGDALFRELSWGGWSCAEFQALVQWMRAWNADDKHEKKLQLVGLDVTHTRASALLLTDFYPRADMIGGQRFASWMAAFRSVNDKGLPPYERFDEEDRESLRLMMNDLVGVFPDEHDNYVQRVPEAEYQIAHQHVRTLGACEEVLRLAGQGWTTRDRERFMPERLDWMLARCGEGAKAMVWARNAFVGVQGEAEYGSFGWYLKQKHGDAYATIALCVGAGRARLPDGTIETKGNAPAAEFALAEPVPGTLEEAFARTGKPAGIVDLKKLDAKGAARVWLATEHLRRSLDVAWYGELSLLRRGTTLAEFDRVAWLGAAHPATPLPAK